MKWKSTSEDPWKKKFAIFPVHIGKAWVWLEYYDVSAPFYAYNDIYWTRRYPSKL